MGASRLDGAIDIDDSKGSPVDQVLELTRGEGADKGCECVGYQAHDIAGQEQPNVTLNQLMRPVRLSGALGVYNRYLCRLLHEGRPKPSFLVSHELSLEHAADAYRHFDARESGWPKVVLKPR